MTRSVPAGAPQHLRSWRSFAGSHRTWVAMLGMAALSATAWTAIAVMDDSTASVTAAQAAGTDTSSTTVQTTPLAGTVLYKEDFENVVSNATVPTALGNYRSTTGIAYTASTYWLDEKFCNGFITSWNTELNNSLVTTNYCGPNGSGTIQGDYLAVRAKAYALGRYAGETSDTAKSNHALSTNTSGGTPDTQGAMFQTKSNSISVGSSSASKRFIAFSVDAADTGTISVNGSAAQPAAAMYFYLLQGENEKQLNTSALPGSSSNKSFNYLTGQTDNLDISANMWWAGSGHVGTYYSDAFTVTTQQDIGLKLVNTSTASSTGCGAYGNNGNSNTGLPACVSNGSGKNTGSANGNDGAIDNIEILDVTPTMTKAFSPERVPVGETSTMTITVWNREDLGEKSGWSFTDTMPNGLVFSDNPTLGGTCLNQTDSNNKKTDAKLDGLNKLVVTNGVLAKGTISCTFTVSVTSQQAKTFTNGSSTGNFTNQVGIDGPNDAIVEFYPWIQLQKNIVGRLDEGDQFKLAVESNDVSVVGATSTTTGSTTGDGQALTDKVELKSGVPYTLSETAGTAGMSDLSGYTTEFKCIDTLNHDSSVTVTSSSETQKSVERLTGASSTEMLGVKCTFTNTPKAKLTLVKRVAKSYAGESAAEPTKWALKAVGDGKPPATISGSTGGTTITNAAVPVGSYSLSENDGPLGYSASEWACVKTGTTDAVPVTFSAVTLASGDDVTCTITNTAQPGSVTWSKVDSSDASTLLSGSEWTLTPTNPSGAAITVIDDGENDADPMAGKIKIENLSWGTYTLKETKAPAGYVLSDTEYTVTINGTNSSVSPQSNGKDVAEIKNTQAEVPDLPLTGGMSTDAFLLGGGGLLALAGLGGFIHRRRSLRLARA